jgi:RsiW-degrading membrane proteinase PrsW (M82 family)
MNPALIVVISALSAMNPALIVVISALSAMNPALIATISAFSAMNPALIVVISALSAYLIIGFQIILRKSKKQEPQFLLFDRRFFSAAIRSAGKVPDFL